MRFWPSAFSHYVISSNYFNLRFAYLSIYCPLFYKFDDCRTHCLILGFMHSYCKRATSTELLLISTSWTHKWLSSCYTALRVLSECFYSSGGNECSVLIHWWKTWSLNSSPITNTMCQHTEVDKEVALPAVSPQRSRKSMAVYSGKGNKAAKVWSRATAHIKPTSVICQLASPSLLFWWWMQLLCDNKDLLRSRSQ